MIHTSFVTSIRPGRDTLAQRAAVGPATLPCVLATDMPTPDARFVNRLLTEVDIPAVVAMEQAACMHPVHAWSADNYRSSLRAGYWVHVRCEADTGRIVAVCVAMDGVDEVHLLNIAVAREHHGQGLARSLLDVLYARCRQRQAATLWLEVRPSNTAARSLYEREGFTQVGVRKNYYPAADGREDALVMKRDVPAHNGATHALE
jgi:ribosomal-protein-alanine N-acetyltransferase